MNFWDFFFLILVIAPVVYRVARNGGLKGAVFNAPVARAISELDLRRGGTRTKLQVYLLDPRDPVRGPHIGIALRSSTASAWAIRVPAHARRPVPDAHPRPSPAIGGSACSGRS